HPKLGGYLQPDALDILAGGNVHPYAYASNNPVNVIDPTGLYDLIADGIKGCAKYSNLDKWVNCFYSYVCLFAIWGCAKDLTPFVFKAFHNSRPLHSLQLQTGLDLSDYIKRLATHFANGFMDDTTFGLTGFGYENGRTNAAAYYTGTAASLGLGLLYGGTYVKGGMLLAKVVAPKLIAESVKASVATGKITQASHEAGKIREFVTTVAEGAVAKGTPDITKAYKRPPGATTVEQRASIQGKPCVDCGAVTPKQVADHKNPLVKEYYETGTIDTTWMRSVDAVQPQCPTCSARQGADMSRYSQQMKKELGLD
ncbi:RHS repeat-associated core domain-containing protein, partial [Fastidiosibacter lacustris]|uniref:RHS repeat-associated core domain-containing protein n=1 Tax=Fastidiosibacter lacustris TaxID=2056695 RepID=UPI0023D90CF7